MMYPTQKIVFMTPAKCVFYGAPCIVPSPHPSKLEDARPLIEYVRVIEKTGKKMGIPVLNLYEKLDINPMERDDCRRFTTDGLHFNDEGHAKIADLLADFLLSI